MPRLKESEYRLRMVRALDALHRLNVTGKLAQDKVLELLREDKLPTAKKLAARIRLDRYLHKSNALSAAKVVLAEIRKPSPRRLAPG